MTQEALLLNRDKKSVAVRLLFQGMLLNANVTPVTNYQNKSIRYWLNYYLIRHKAAHKPNSCNQKASYQLTTWKQRNCHSVLSFILGACTKSTSCMVVAFSLSQGNIYTYKNWILFNCIFLIYIRLILFSLGRESW